MNEMELLPADQMTPRVALVTGGSSGIGKAIAIRLAKEGWRVAILARDEPRLRDVGQELSSLLDSANSSRKLGTNHRELGPTNKCVFESDDVMAFACETLSMATNFQIVNDIVNRWGRLDAAICNAGVAPMGSLESLTETQFDETIGVNCAGLFYLAKSCVQPFKKQAGGCLVYISSLAAIDPFPGFSLYGASKAWGSLFVKAIANEWSEFGSRAYSICPGAVETLLLRRLFPDFPADQTLSTDDLAETVWLVLSDKLKLENGVSISCTQEAGSMKVRQIFCNQTELL